MTTEAKPRSFLTVDLKCGCGSHLFIEVPQEAAATYLSEKLLHLATVWSTQHSHGPTLEKLVGAAHHKEPKK